MDRHDLFMFSVKLINYRFHLHSILKDHGNLVARTVELEVIQVGIFTDALSLFITRSTFMLGRAVLSHTLIKQVVDLWILVASPVAELDLVLPHLLFGLGPLAEFLSECWF